MELELEQLLDCPHERLELCLPPPPPPPWLDTDNSCSQCGDTSVTVVSSLDSLERTVQQVIIVLVFSISILIILFTLSLFIWRRWKVFFKKTHVEQDSTDEFDLSVEKVNYFEPGLHSFQPVQQNYYTSKQTMLFSTNSTILIGGVPFHIISQQQQSPPAARDPVYESADSSAHYSSEHSAHYSNCSHARSPSQLSQTRHDSTRCSSLSREPSPWSQESGVRVLASDLSSSPGQITEL